jgi:hypothetical protein
LKRSIVSEVWRQAEGNIISVSRRSEGFRLMEQRKFRRRHGTDDKETLERRFKKEMKDAFLGNFYRV